MIEAIRRFLEESLPANGQRQEHDELQLAAAALLIEVMSADYHEEDCEREAITRAVGKLFGLAPQDGARLVSRAQEELRHATDDYEFTSRINHGFSAQQKEALMEALWSVAYADGNVDMYERHYLGKLAELLYISPASFISAKRRVCGGGDGQ
ncbi:MAG: tellurite resistance TerB family protein [Acidiferrobacterales bacterium]